MAITKLVLKTSGNVYGYQADFVSSDGEITIEAGRRIKYDPATKITNRLAGGYLFRNPEMRSDEFIEIWHELQHCEGKVKVSAEYDTKTKNTCCYIRFEDHTEATSFILSSDTFEKWSDENTKNEKAELKKKKKGSKLKVNDDGTVTVNVTVTTMDDDPD